jgi:hypothetical protein
MALGFHAGTQDRLIDHGIHDPVAARRYFVGQSKRRVEMAVTWGDGNDDLHTAILSKPEIAPEHLAVREI